MTDQNLTEIICVVDRSGSMEVARDDFIGGFNTFLKEQKKQPGKALLTYCQFDTEYEIVHNGKSIGDVPEINKDTYVPRGGTALNDAIGRTLNEVGARLKNTPENQRPGKVIVVILTDGQENSSKEFTTSRIKAMVEEQTAKYNWQFVYLGANQDSFATSAGYGVLASNTMNYSQQNHGTAQVYASISNSVSTFRSTGQVVLPPGTSTSGS